MVHSLTTGWMVVLAPALVMGAAALEPPGAEIEPLRSARSVHALSLAEADRELPVVIEAVVTHHAQESGYGFFVQDDSGAVFIHSRKIHDSLDVGDLIRVFGTTLPGEYAPSIRLDHYEPLGRGAMPPPLQVGADELRAGSLDCAYVELQGQVRDVELFPETRPPQAVLTLRGGSQDVAIRILYGSSELFDMVESRVTVRGVATGVFSRQRQMLAPMLLVSSPDELRIDQPAAAWEDIPLYSAGRLFQFSVNHHPDGRVRVRGTVLGHRPGEWLAIQDATGGLWVDTSVTQTYKLGDIVEFAGFPEAGLNSLRLGHAIGRVVDTGPTPRPVTVDFRTALNQPCQLRRMVGKLTGPPVPGDKVWVLNLEQNGRPFEAVAPANTPQPPSSWRTDAELAVVGITEPLFVGSIDAPQYPTPQRLRIHARHPTDIVLHTPAPWYLSPARVRAIAISLAVAITLAATFFLLSLALAHRNRSLAEARSDLSAARDELAQRYERRTGQLREHLKARDEAEAEAALLSGERTRLARELHDGLQQGLTSVSLMLDATRELLPQSPEKSMRLLETSAAQLRHCHEDVRRSVWGLRALALENANLPQALRELSESLDTDLKPSIDFECEGSPRNLAPRAAHGIFRIVQEAVTNALKHAAADHIEIGLKYEPDTLLAWVKDNGHGFTAPVNGDDENEHFGMKGLEERATNLGAQLEVNSVPGKGTRLQVLIPFPSHGDSPA